jgi:hypothetical protein
MMAWSTAASVGSSGLLAKPQVSAFCGEYNIWRQLISIST